MSSISGSAIPESPCVRNCCLDDDDICMGCGRSLQEITHWSSSTIEDRKEILLRAADRKNLIRLRQQI